MKCSKKSTSGMTAGKLVNLLFENNTSVAMVANKLGVKRQYIYMLMKKHGVSIKKKIVIDKDN